MKITEILKSVSGNDNSAFFFSPSLYKEEKCYLFSSPDKIITVNSYAEHVKAFQEVEKLRNDQSIVALLNYEAGYLFEEKFKEYLPENSKEDLITLLCYNKKNCRVFNSHEIIMPEESEYLTLNDYEIGNMAFNTTNEEYFRAITAIKKHIYEGDTYQVNYTLKSKYNFKGGFEKLFLNLICNQSTRYSAYINLKNKMVISISPELFFEINGDEITTRPMKGTLHRGINLIEDSEMKQQLLNSDKDKAENVMIADLLRNDLGRISQFGTVKAESLFEIEKYESVYQLTSSINAQLKEKSIGKIIENIFPCGSITGAPKMRTMEIIKELEKEERGIYTGAIGIIDDKSVKFNVAIRTLVIDKKSGNGEMGLGGGIVWDSEPDKEFKEVELKGRFLTRQDKQFQLIETLLYENGNYFLLEEHLERLRISADYFLFSYDKEIIIKKLLECTAAFTNNRKYRVRLLLKKSGNLESSSEITELNDDEVKVIISDERINSRNKFQYFKTTNMQTYYTGYQAAGAEGFFDALFLNENNEITEGAITNVFFLIDNTWYTPEISSGLLAGCYREYFIKTNKVIEKKLYISDLLSAQKIMLTNSVRKEIFVSEIWQKKSQIWNQIGL